LARDPEVNVTASVPLEAWLSRLGYAEAAGSLHRTAADIPATHPYASEIATLLAPGGLIRAKAVFDIEGVPTVCFFEDHGAIVTRPEQFDSIRQAIWNQNLVSVLLVVNGDVLTPLPSQKLAARREPLEAPLSLEQASADGPFSAAEFRANSIQKRLPTWFRPERRVDEYLLQNLGQLVRQLSNKPRESGLDRAGAQMLLGQVLFVLYLEHRGIVGDQYRARRGVQQLRSLIDAFNGKGVQQLLAELKDDLNGDFLDPEGGAFDRWPSLTEFSFKLLSHFLARGDIQSGQTSFWGYDFSYIPVELLSGIYESFLGPQQRRLAAYYTPRHLANLAVTEVFRDRDPLQEVIYDGACGSGILLTTAFRRMLVLAEERAGRQLKLQERIDLLRQRIFGSDKSDMACRVTAFSLYLSLMERLEPQDIVALQKAQRTKLPPLRGKNLIGGDVEGDFFSPQNPLAARTDFTIYICNPPWKQPGAKSAGRLAEEEEATDDQEDLEEDEAEDAGEAVDSEEGARPFKQIAAGFANRAIGRVKGGGRLCLILPLALFLGGTSRGFVREWFRQVRPLRLINFGDLQQLLFKASHGCALVVGEVRGGKKSEITETFEYWAPKADLSLAMGRLTLHSGDRHVVNTHAIADDHQRLVTLMWGDVFDVSLLARLSSRGTLGETVDTRSGWVARKGFHVTDAQAGTADQDSFDRLRAHRYLGTEQLQDGSPALNRHRPVMFPREITSVAPYDPELLELFKRPRILFPDGFDSEREIRAVFTSVKAAFPVSVGVIAGPRADEDLLRFIAVYLRSDLARYFVLMTCFQVLTERNKVSLIDVRRIPFFAPDRCPDPVAGAKIVGQVAQVTRELELVAPDDQRGVYEQHRSKLEDQIAKYFGLTDAERAVVTETARELVPRVRPRGYKKLFARNDEQVAVGEVRAYASRLQASLEDWKARLDGKGRITVTADTLHPGSIGGLGVVRISIQGRGRTSGATVRRNDQAVVATLKALAQAGVAPMELAEGFYFSPDSIFWLDQDMYLVRPLLRRFWLERAAIRDSRSVVLKAQSAAGAV